VPTAIITGVTGQDGSYLAEHLLSKGYRVIGVMRRSSVVTFERIQHIQDLIDIIQGDLHDQSSLMDLMEQYKPDEVYNLLHNPLSPHHGTSPS
jgi:GDPmannose 4,6-dehydratase